MDSKIDEKEVREIADSLGMKHSSTAEEPQRPGIVSSRGFKSVPKNAPLPVEVPVRKADAARSTREWKPERSSFWADKPKPGSPEMAALFRAGTYEAAKPGTSREDQITAALREAPSPVGGLSMGLGQGARVLAEVERLTADTTTGRVWDFNRDAWVISTRLR